MKRVTHKYKGWLFGVRVLCGREKAIMDTSKTWSKVTCKRCLKVRVKN